MNTFLVVAALMAALAAAAVALPLWRDRAGRTPGVIAAVLIAGAAAGFYPLWSNWDWHATVPGGAASPDVQAMIAKLEAHLKEKPDDATGWVMLGRSYLALERQDDAILAYDHAHRLDAGNAEAALGLGESMSLRAQGNITPAAGELFEQAVKLAPDNPKALLYSGFAAAARGDNANARLRWESLMAMHPPEQIEKVLEARIAELGPADATAASAGGSALAGAAGPGQGTTPAPAAPDSDVGATLSISLAPQLRSRLTHEAPLFVFARESGTQGGPPLAAKRLTSAAIGSQVRLTAADSMIPSRVLVNGHKVSITARVSFSGQPQPAQGDLYGELIYDVGHDGVRDLVIDRVTE